MSLNISDFKAPRITVEINVRLDWDSDKRDKKDIPIDEDIWREDMCRRVNIVSGTMQGELVSIIGDMLRIDYKNSKDAKK
jgi:hypothetical protein